MQKKCSSHAFPHFTCLLCRRCGRGIATPYQAFSNGYGYMEKLEISALTEAVKKGDHKVVREHSWKLWAGIVQPVDWPVWFT